MAEANANSEIAKHLTEHGSHGGSAHAGEPAKRSWRPEAVEILEAILLAIVAVVTAWSGYQAALWDGESAKEYATSSRYRAEGNEKALEANQYLSYNAGTLNAWITAMTTDATRTAAVLEHRFTPNFKVAFDAWLKTDPLTNPDAPAGPGIMPQYKDPVKEEAAKLNAEASHAFDLGVEYRLRAEHYVQVTVLLAAVLFLIALGQRFKFRGVRAAVIIVAGGTLAYVLVLLMSYPRI